MKWSRKILGTGTVFLLTTTGCGGSHTAEAEETSPAPEALELARTLREDPRSVSATVLAAARDEVELPSHRRLAGFLPESLSGFEQAHRTSDHELPSGRAIATGRYQTSTFDYENAVEVEISFNGKPTFNVAERLFESGLGKREELAGFEAMLDEDEEDSPGRSRVEIWIRLSSELWVQVSGPDREQLDEAVDAIDLPGLAAALADRTLFEEAPADVLERKILSGAELSALFPASVGGLERRGGNGFERFDLDPVHSQANAQYGSGTLTLTDFGDPEVAAAIALDASSLQGFTLFAGQDADAVRSEVLEVVDGRGSCAVLVEEPPRNSVLGLHVARGRFVAEYVGRFVPAPEPLGDALPDELRNEIERATAEMGAGAFQSLEAQRDAMLGVIEDLDLEPNKN